MKTKFFTLLVLGILFLLISPGYAQSVLPDGSFDTPITIAQENTYPPAFNTWLQFLNSGTVADASVVDNTCFFQISNAGTSTWEVQLTEYGFPLIQGHSYRLSFDVKADADRTFGLFLGEYEGNWTNLLGWDRYTQNATTVWQTISLDFNSTCVFAVNKISFELGGINTNMYFDNIVLQDLGPYTPVISIVGNSVNGWDADVDMLTTDGVHYTLSNYPLTAGGMKFRQDHTWCFNWGSSDFPSGMAFQDGPGIPVSNFCNYDITFNRETGEYSILNASNCAVDLGIIGSAVPPSYGADPDVKLFTKDRVNYALKGYAFIDGGARFRQANSWDINWGNNTFPTGTGILNGGEIPVKAGSYNVSFNIITGDYSFTFPDIGIVGSALNGWDNDISMQTTDGVNYTLGEYSFFDGEVKFRADKNWDINWGGYSFPTGWAYQDGPNIQVQAGTYKVTFNRVTGEYNFTATTCPIAGIHCPDNQYAVNSPGICGAYVYYPEVTGAANCGGAGLVIAQTGGLPSGSLFPKGTTTNTFVLTNASGNTATCSFDVIVFDFEPPVIKVDFDDIKSIWPPNHKMVPVRIKYKTSDNCGHTTNQLYVSSNEPESGLGDGDKSPDWKILDEHNVLLRAERSAHGTGREYYINIVSHDDSWNYSFQQIVVRVPLNKGKRDDDSENGNHYDNEKKSEVIVENNILKVDVWPNPSAQNFNMQVESTSDSPVVLNITDMTGRLISKIDGLNNESIHFGDDLKSGIYFIRVQQGDFSKTIKVVKQ